MNSEIKNARELKKAIKKCRRVLIFGLFCDYAESWVILSKKEALNLVGNVTDEMLSRHPQEYDADQNIVYLQSVR